MSAVSAIPLEAVRHQAYLLWLERGCQPDTAERDWHDAELLLASHQARGAAAATTRFRRTGLVRLEREAPTGARTTARLAAEQTTPAAAAGSTGTRRGGLVRLSDRSATPPRRRAGLVKLDRRGS